MILLGPALYLLFNACRLVDSLKILSTAELNPFIGAENSLEAVRTFSSRKFHTALPSNEKYCQYSVRYAGSNTVDSPYILFAFRVSQKNCRSNTTASGGSSFQAFLNSSDAMATCSTIDLLDNDYIIFCTLPTTSATIVSSLYPLCADLTILLESEHFEWLSASTSDIPPRQPVRLHQLQYCTHSTHFITDSKVSLSRALHVLSSNKITLPKNVRWYSAHWVKAQAKPKTKHSSHAINNMSQLSNGLLCEPVLHSAGSENMVKQLSSSDITPRHCLQNGFNHKYCNANTTQSSISLQLRQPTKHTHQIGNLDDSQYLRNVTSENKHEFHFLGGKTMRNYFDSLVAYYFGDNPQYRADTPKADDGYVTRGNLHYQSASTVLQVHAQLPKFCDTLQNRTKHADATKHTLVVETGSFLSGMSLQHVLYNASSGAAAVTSHFEGIFNHTLLCGGLARIVLFTSSPCVHFTGVANHNLTLYDAYCSNNAVKAVNSFMVGNMLRVSESAYHIYKTHGTRTHTAESVHHRRLANAVQANNPRETGRSHHGSTSNIHINRHNNAAPVRKKAASDSTQSAINTPSATHLAHERVRIIFPVNLIPVQLSVIDTYTLMQPLLYFDDPKMWNVGIQQVNRLLLTALSIDRHYPGVK